jgi:hypothetical protein
MELVEYVDQDAEVTIVGQVQGRAVYLDSVYDDRTGERMKLSGEDHYLYEQTLREAYNNGWTDDGSNTSRGTDL